MEKIWSQLLTLFEYWPMLLKGLGVTLLITAGAFVIGTVLGFVTAAVKAMPKKNVFIKILQALADVYVTVVRGTPVVVQILICYFVVFAATGLPQEIIGIIVFGINSGAYVTEIIRGGILSVDKGQAEAGRSLGLSYGRTMRHVILPQAAKNAMPSLFNELISLLKETSVIGYIGIYDITKVIEYIVSYNYIALVGFIVLALIYLAIVLLLTLAIKQVEKGLRKNDRA